MTRLNQLRAMVHGSCLSAAVFGMAGDVVLNPHLYGEYVSWTARSTVISVTVLAIWLAVIGITNWAVRRGTSRKLPGGDNCA